MKIYITHLFPCRLTTLRFEECRIHIRINAMAGIVKFNSSVDIQVPT
jgi:hypothetical protein